MCQAGKVYLILTPTIDIDRTIPLAGAEYAFVGENEDDYAGISISGSGDVDGDGFNDVLIGADGNDDGGADAGKAYLMLSSSLTPGTMSLANADYSFIGEDGTSAIQPDS